MIMRKIHKPNIVPIDEKKYFCMHLRGMPTMNKLLSNLHLVREQYILGIVRVGHLSMQVKPPGVVNNILFVATLPPTKQKIFVSKPVTSPRG